ncbi:MAG: hypothetical protein GY856_24810 [bacterium]|nr:hypothetical protein [bacterium]
MNKSCNSAALAAIVLALGAIVSGCAGPPAPGVIAVYDGGEITADDLDQAIVALPSARRRPADGNFHEWYAELARSISARRLLLAEARARKVDEEPEFQERREELAKQIATELYLRLNLPEMPPPTDEELESYYREHRDEYRRPARRRVYHIFRRLEPGSDAVPLIAEMAELRRRVVAGESFSALAAEHSDSESRHREGLLGWVGKGQLAPDLETAIFSLEEGIPSEPLTTREGIHLLLVETALAETRHTFAEVRGLLTRKLRQQRLMEAIDTLAGSELPPGSFVPEPQELRVLLTGGEEQSLLLRIGDYDLRYGELREKLIAARQQAGGASWIELATGMVDSLRQRELIYRRCVEQGLDRDPRVSARLERRLERELTDFFLRRRLEEYVGEDTERLREHYEKNRKRYSEPLRLRMRRLVIPLSSQGVEQMATLERACDDLNAGRRTLDELAAELGGRTEELGWQTLDQLRTLSPIAARLAVDLQAGAFSPPYRNVEHLELVQALERREPQPQSLERARGQVIRDYLSQHGGEVHRDLTEALLAENAFRLLPERLEELVAGRAPGIEAGVEADR